MPDEFTITAIGHVSCTRSQPEDDHWDLETSVLHLDPSVLGANAATGLDGFSHIEVLYVFDRVTVDSITLDARRPRGNPNWPEVGILAQRGKNRPNRIGATVCRLLAVQGLDIRVQGLDAIDGTPIIDIKPVMSGFMPRAPISEPTWAVEIMRDYWIA